MKRFSKIIISLIAVTMLLPGFGQQVAAVEPIQVLRLAGSDRLETAIEISKFAYSTADSVVLAGAYGGEVDALAGTLLAKAKNGPMLLTSKYQVEPTLAAELKRLKAKTVFILGGEAAVSMAVETELKKSYTVKRVFGSDREDTAVAVAREVKGQKKHVFLARGYGVLADALAIGPASAANDIPILLTQSYNLPQITLDAMKEFGVTHVTIIGGIGAVNQTVENQLKGYIVDRISGPDREDTALAIADKYFKDSAGAVIANGYVYADALVGGYLGAKFGAPILLANTNSIPTAVVDHLAEDTTGAFVLGGTAPISDAVFTKINSAVSKTIPLTKVTISGKTIEGSELTASVEPSGAKVAYQWKRWQTTPKVVLTAIPGATAKHYTPVAEDVGWMMVVEATGIGKFRGSVATNTGKITEAVIQEPDFAGGSGTKADPYQVVTAKHLDNVRKYLNDNFIQMADINLGVAPWSNGEGWNPIGGQISRSPATMFTGSYNGNFYKITGLTIDRPDGNDQGLFSSTSETARLSNICLQNINFNAKSVAGLVSLNGGTIEKCYTTGSINGLVSVGGLVGFNTGTIKECYSNAVVKSKGAPSGGLVANNAGSISNSYSTGSINGQLNAGGLTGLNYNGTITNCYATSLTPGLLAHRGGLLGEGLGGQIYDSYFDKDVTIVNDEAEGRTTKEMTTKATFINWDFNKIWTMNAAPASYPYLKWQNNNNIPFAKSEFAGGIGTVDAPYKVATLLQLYRVRFHLDKHFIQTEDIKMEEIFNVWGWNPISSFSGSYNGNGKTIQGLKMDYEETGSYGLFRRTLETAKLSNIDLTDVSITATGNIGSLVYGNSGLIENCKASGRITGDGSTKTAYVGGLVAYNEGSMIDCSATISLDQGGLLSGGLIGYNSGTVRKCFATGQVQGINGSGGLIGFNRGIVESSYANGSVVGSGENTGGLVGQNQGFIANTYATGVVTGVNNVGGLVGRNEKKNSNGENVYINCSYATGRVTATNSVGKTYVAGIVGYNDDGWIQYCYYDKETTGRNDTGKGDPKTTVEMTKRTTFPTWDFGGTWMINTSPASYPYFQWEGYKP